MPSYCEQNLLIRLVYRIEKLQMKSFSKGINFNSFLVITIEAFYHIKAWDQNNKFQNIRDSDFKQFSLTQGITKLLLLFLQ